MAKKKSSRASRARRSAAAPSPTAIDRQVGARIRVGRKLRGMSLQDLAKALKVSYQQVQKYELGRNRVSAGRLFELTVILDFPITFFFYGAPKSTAVGFSDGSKEDPEAMSRLNKRETLEFVRALRMVNDPQLRKRILALVRLLGDQGDL